MTLHLCTGYRDASGKLADAGISSVMMTMTPFVKSPDVRLRTGNRQTLKRSDLKSRKIRKRRIAWDFQKPVTGSKTHTHTHTHQLTPLLLPQILRRSSSSSFLHNRIQHSIPSHKHES
jgi:hypothetical protein